MIASVVDNNNVTRVFTGIHALPDAQVALQGLDTRAAHGWGNVLETVLHAKAKRKG